MAVKNLPVLTGDGSLTMFCRKTGEHYHSTKDGAFSEALHKFVLPAWKYRISGRRRITVLDVCFGLGYNTFTLLWFLKSQGYQGKLRILSPELDTALLSGLGSFVYPAEFSDLAPVIQSVVEKGGFSGPGLSLEVIASDARVFLEHFAGQVDVVFHDPFSPVHNPSLWTREYFSALRRVASPDLLLTTYSTATAVRMGLFENGFHVYENHPAILLRKSTLASLAPLPLPEIDMYLKCQRNPRAASLRDIVTGAPKAGVTE